LYLVTENKTRDLTIRIDQNFSFTLLVILIAGVQIFSYKGIAQNDVIDSLQHELETTTQPDHYHLYTFYRLSKQYQNIDTDKSIEVAQKLLKITNENDSLFWSTFALDLLITNYERLNKYDSCVKYLEQAIQISKDINKPHDVAYFQSQLGNSQVKLGNYYDALENYEDAVKYSEKDSSLIKYETAFLTNIGGIYHYLGDDLKALDYFLQSYYLKKENNLTDNLAPSLINIASVYSKLDKFDDAINTHTEALEIARKDKDLYYQMKALTGLGLDFFMMEDFTNSEKNYLEALVLSDSINDKTSKANILAKLSNVYKETGQYDIAKTFAIESLDLSHEVGYQYGISSFSTTLADLYIKENNTTKAFPLLKESIKISKEIGAMENLRDGYFSISNLYEGRGDNSNALKFYKLYSSLSDSLLKHEEADKFTVVQVKYEMEKKAREVENLTHKNELNELQLTRSRYLLYAFIVFFLMVFLFLVLLIRQNRMRSIQKTILLEQKLLRSQMNPHFIFNTLIAIQKYIHNKSTTLAIDFLGRFSKLMRFILNSSSTEQISLEDELVFLENYSRLQALRFENKFEFRIDQEIELETEEIFIPPMLIQPFIENAIEHGLRPLDKGGMLKISIQQNDDFLRVEVEDNGIGREKANRILEENKPGHTSMATNITRERLEHLNKKSNRNISFEIIDRKDKNNLPMGTRVVLHIPIGIE